MVVSAIYYHIHSLRCCQEADDTKLIFHPIFYLQFLIWQAGRISSRNFLLLLSMRAADLLSIFLSTFIHSSVIDCLPALRTPTFSIVPWYLKIVDLACYGVMKCGQIGPSEEKTYQQSTQTLLFVLVCTLPLPGWLICDPRRKAGIKILWCYVLGFFNQQEQ